MRPQEYNPLLEGTRSSNVILRNVFFTTFRRSFTHRVASAPSVTVAPRWEIKDDLIIFSQTYSATVEDETDGEAFMILKATYEVALQTGGRYTDEFAEEYSERQLHMLLRPYFRELLSNITPRALLMVPALGSQFVAPREIIEPEETAQALEAAN